MVAPKSQSEPVRRDRFSANFLGGAQIVYCPWHGRDRVFRYTGPCVSCRRRTWGADDGENDPRGVLGDSATHALVASDYDRAGSDVPLCAICANEYDLYRDAVETAMRVWREPATSE